MLSELNKEEIIQANILRGRLHEFSFQGEMKYFNI